MWSRVRPCLTLHARLSILVVGLVLSASMMGGCATVVDVQAGSRFNPALLEQSLRTGVSTQRDVQAALGQPYGRGRALMPFHETDHTVWTYFHEQGAIDVSTSEGKDRRSYLFVFFAEDRFDGYMWFVSDMR